MRIVFATDTYWPRVNGATVSIDAFKLEFEKLGHEVHIIAPEYPNMEPSPDPTIHRFKSYQLLFSPEDRLVWKAERWKIFRTLKRLNPDIIHCQTEFQLSIMVMKFGRKRNIPIIFTCHTYWEEYINLYLPFPDKIGRQVARSMQRAALKYVDEVVTPTEPMKEVLHSYGIKKPIHVLPTGVPEDDFAGLDRQDAAENSFLFKEFPGLKGNPLLLYVGRVTREKNMDFLMDCFKTVREQVPDLHFLITGGGPYLSELKKKVKKRDYGASVTFTGYVPKEKVKYLYAMADVFVFASKTETQGLVTIESMMAGTPVVAIGEMGTKIVMNGDNGGFMVSEDMELFSSKVLSLLTDNALWQRKSAEAVEYAKNWSSETMAERLFEIYRSIKKRKEETEPEIS